MNNQTEVPLADVLPAAAQATVNTEMRNSFLKIKLPKGANRSLCYRAIDRVLDGKLAIVSLRSEMGLLPSEVKYVDDIVQAFHAVAKSVVAVNSEGSDTASKIEGV